MIKTIGIVLLMFVLLLVLTACFAENEEEPIYNENENNVNNEEQEIDWSRYPIVINGEGITNAVQTIGEDAIWPTHVPIVAVAEKLGEEVTVDGTTNEVTLNGLNGAISFTVGSSDFSVDGQTVTLPDSSVEVDGIIYVPIRFFRDVFGAPSAFVDGGHVYINTLAAEGDMH